MRYAVIADIHANPVALAAVLDDMKSRNIDRLLCCGDIVGYNARPNEAIELLRKHAVLSIAGNHDLLVSGRESDESMFSRKAARAVAWSKTATKPENLEYLARLPRTTRVDDDILLLHGALSGTPFPEMVRLLNVPAAEEAFGDMAARYPSCRVGFFGHIHAARVYVNENGVTSQIAVATSPLVLSPDYRYLVNPGSICESRDLDSRASYAVYDASTRELSVHKVAFNNREITTANRRAGLAPGQLRKLVTRVRRLIAKLLA